MKLLLDTHVFIWLDISPEKLSPTITAHLTNRENTLIVSVISIWEIQIKHQLGKLRLEHSLKEMIEAQQRANQIEILPVTLNQVLMLENLPYHHKDPFDRLLIAQAKAEDIPLVSNDGWMPQYPIQVLW